MLKLLSKLLNRDLTTPAEPIDTNVSDKEILEILRPENKSELSARKKSLQSFVQFATRKLNKTESQRLCRVARRALDDADYSMDALAEVIFGEEGQRPGKWVFIQLDWNARDQIAWQVAEILIPYGINDRWEPDVGAEYKTVPEALSSLSEWLSDRGLVLMHLDTGSDGYCSLIVEASDVAVSKELAAAAHIGLHDHAEFSSLYG